MEFKEYQHVEKLGTVDTEGIELGTCYIFPKIDGTNASIWMDECNQIQTGSRTRWLAEGQSDNAGFREAVNTQIQFEGIIQALKEKPKLRFYGEWLVPHTLKTYRQDTWRKFYVFDVTELRPNEDGITWEQYLTYEEYKNLCDKYQIEYIPSIAIIGNPTIDDFVRVAGQNNYLIEDGKGNGEGIVIKNYDYKNKFGRTIWAKLVTSEFKEKHYKEMGSPEKDNILVEDEIAKEYCTSTLIDKTHAKISVDMDGWSSKYIPRLLETVFHDIVTEEIYSMLKKFNQPTINFKHLRVFVIKRIKEIKPELF